MRDDFSIPSKEVLAKRVGFRCSNPKCGKLTAGPQADGLKAINIGVAAHITAAAPGGPRYDSGLSAKERTSIENGVWLCQSCAKLIDNDPGRYPAALLHQWKRLAEGKALTEIESSARIFPSLEPHAYEEEFARVLMPDVPVATSYRIANAEGASVDYSVYPFVVEELVSVGVCSMAVVRGTGPDLAIPLLPNFLRERITVIEPSTHSEKIKRLFVPVEEELDKELSFSGIPVFGVSTQGPTPAPIDAIVHACACLYPAIFKLMLGMQYGLQIEIDLAEAARASSYLRKKLRSPKARGVFAIVAGVLSAYTVTELDTVEFSTRVLPRERARLLAQLLDEQDYRLMGHGGYQLGVPDLIGNALKAFAIYSRKLLELSTYRDALQSTSRSVQAVLVSPFTSLRSREPDLSGLYLPPVFSYHTVQRRAQESWLEIRPEPLLRRQPIEGLEVDKSWIVGEYERAKEKNK